MDTDDAVVAVFPDPAGGFLVIAHGSAVEGARAETILNMVNPSRLDPHFGVSAAWAVDDLASAAG
jgi:hypothetical protein